VSWFRWVALERVDDTVIHLTVVTRFLKNYRTKALLCLLFALFIGIYFWSPLIEARFSIIDDHDIVSFIGQRERLPLSEIPKVMLDRTEIGKWGAEQRFRPSYYSLYLLQASVFGKHPSAWYTFNIVIALLFYVVLAIVGLRITAPIVVFGFLSYELSQSYWADIFARLGVGETYDVLGVSICAIGVMLGLRKNFTGVACALVAIGIVIAAGAKENFVLLAVVPLWILTMRASTVTAAGKLWLIGAMLYSVVIAAIVFAGVYNAGHDYYDHSISPTNTLHLIVQFFQKIDVWVWILSCALFWLIIRVAEHKGLLRPAVSQKLKAYVAAAVILLLVYSSQFVFYSGDFLYNEGRYLFPTVLARDVSILIASIIITKLIVGNTGRSSWGAVASLITAGCFLFATVAGWDWDHNRLSAQQRVIESKEFTGKVQAGAAFLKEHPSAALILNSHSAWDFEPVYSINQYMRAAGISNPIALKINNYSSDALRRDSNPLVPVLAADLEDVQAKGGKGGWSGFVPLESIPKKAGCYSYGLYGPPAANCVAGEIIWPPGKSVEQISYDGQILSFARDGNGSNYLRSGWSQAEDWGVWSDGPTATVVLADAALAGKPNVELAIEARGFVKQGQTNQRVHVRVNGVDAGELLLGWDITSTSLAIPAEALKSSLLQIELVPETPISPATAGISSDQRLLGIGLKSLQLGAVQPKEVKQDVKPDQFSYEGQILSFARDGNGSNYLRSGWSQAEDWGVWSDGPIATVVLADAALAGKPNVELAIEARGFVTQSQPKQRVSVRVNGVDAGELSLRWDITSTSLQVPAQALQSSLLQIELVPETPISPATTGASSDQRLLGIGLKSLQLRDITTQVRQ
jgi:hypothetical protein